MSNGLAGESDSRPTTFDEDLWDTAATITTRLHGIGVVVATNLVGGAMIVGGMLLGEGTRGGKLISDLTWLTFGALVDGQGVELRLWV